MKRTCLAFASLLVLASVLPSAAEEPKKPPTSPKAGAAAPAAVKTPFRISVDANWIFVANYGTEDWKGPLDVNVSCKPVVPTTSCGLDFPGGTFRAPYPAFPKGYGIAPVKGPGSAQQPWGPGWIAVFMGLPPGSYKITATAANNASPETNVTIATPGGNKVKASPGVKAKPGTIKLAPTKTPSR